MKNFLCPCLVINLSLAAVAQTWEASQAKAAETLSLEAAGTVDQGGALRVVDFPLVFPSGTEGGKSALNKVSWNGLREFGAPPGQWHLPRLDHVAS